MAKKRQSKSGEIVEPMTWSADVREIENGFVVSGWCRRKKKHVEFYAATKQEAMDRMIKLLGMAK